MTRRTSTRSSIAALGLATSLLSACGGGGGGGCDNAVLGVLAGGCDKPAAVVPPPPANQAPTAQAGTDRDAVVGSSVTLDGSGSRDPEGKALSFTWSVLAQPTGSQITLADANTAKPSFTPATIGVYRFNLVVSDGASTSAPSTVLITALAPNKPPVAHAGTSRSAITGTTVTLDGSASDDPNRDLLTYYWAVVSRPPGSTATLGGDDTVRPTFLADRDGSYVFSLRVSDGKLSSDLSYVTITASAANAAPTAVASGPQEVLVNSPVTLDGSASTDPNRDELSHTWALVSRPASSNTTLSATSAVRPTFTPDLPGAYVFSLKVSDGRTDSPAAFVTVNAGLANVAPVAAAGIDQYVAVGETVSLDGTGSSDGNRDPLQFRWAFVSKPAGSTASLSPAGSARPRFIADTAGVYVVSLVASDGMLDSAPQYVTVTASNFNQRPVALASGPQQVAPNTLVTLDGTGSSDANRDPLTYSWTLDSRPNGSNATLSSRSVVRPTFTADVAGTYVASLQVSDGKLTSALSVAVVTAATTNAAPEARIGQAQQNVKVRSTVVLDGSTSRDTDGDPLQYTWSIISAPPGSTVGLAGSTAPIASMVPDGAGVYVVALRVFDGRLQSAPAYTTIVATQDNAAPTARAGVDRSVLTGTTVVLDGSGSFDPDGDALAYSWSLVSRPVGSSASLSSASSARPSLVADLAGTYVASLAVTDTKSASSPLAITVITAASGPMPPVANAGAAQTVKVGSAVQLDGTLSYDPNGDPITFFWQMNYRPAGSSAGLDGNVLGSRSTSTSARPAFVADVVGVYVLTLVVRDSSMAESKTAVVTVTVTP